MGAADAKGQPAACMPGLASHLMPLHASCSCRQHLWFCCIHSNLLFWAAREAVHLISRCSVLPPTLVFSERFRSFCPLLVQEMADLISQCMALDPSERPTAQQVCHLGLQNWGSC